MNIGEGIERASMNKPALLKQYADRLSPGRGKPQFVKAVQDYLSSTDVLDRASVAVWVMRMERRGLSPGTIKLRFGAVRTFFKVCKLDWGFRRGEGPRVTEQDEKRPALSLGVVSREVMAARDGMVPTECVAFLAIATTYGFRRGEMAAIGPDDVRPDLIFRHTEKGGRPRWHQIPPEIAPYIHQHDWSLVKNREGEWVPRYSPDYIGQIFWYVVNATGGLDALKSIRLGWHAYRRPLLRLLVDNGCGGLAAKRFLCWGSGEGESDAMPLRYYANTEIDIEGEVVVSREAESDTEIFEKYHPYLKLWEAK